MIAESIPLKDSISNDSDYSLSYLHTSLKGLSHTETAKRMYQYGRNVLKEEKRSNIFKQLINTLNNPLIIILLFASVFSFLTNEKINAVIIFLIVIMSALLDFFQEYQANNAAEKLKERVATKATVLREGEEHEINTADLVIGDIILLSSGDLVPADARIISSKDFFVNQSSLTGESLPVEKTADKCNSNTSLNDMNNIVFLGTNVVSGIATAVIIRTGSQTEFGKIANKLAEAPLESAFIKGINNYSFLIMRTTIFFVMFIFVISLFFKHINILEAFTFAIAVAVGLTPELLPMILSVTMGRGSVKMAKKGVIVKKLTAIPNFGSMNILCTDKTGTLTENRIQLVTYTDVTGNHSEKVLLYAYLNSVYHTGIKNPLDEAVIQFRKVEDHGFKKFDEIPFDFTRKKMSVVVEKDNKHILITKGAPEEILLSSTSYWKDNKKISFEEAHHEKVMEEYYALSNEGYRVLAVAIKEISQKKSTYTKDDECDLELMGYVAFLDPPKKSVKQILEELTELGLTIKVITGDNELVAQKICSEVGLQVKGVLLGSEAERLTDNALKEAAEKSTLFARFSPEEKNRVIIALKGTNNVVGYLGDGINDAPSLRSADVGISVENAVDVAKESAEIVLTHKSLQQLKEGVIEGRKTFGNTMKYVMMGTSSNFGNMFSILGAIIFIPFLPMLPIQILLNNFLYDISQLVIPSDNVDQEFIQSPKKWDIHFLKNFVFIFGPLSSIFDFATFYMLYVVFKSFPGQFQTGWFIESLASQILVIYIYRTRKVPFLQSAPSLLLFCSTFFIVILGLIFTFSPIGSLFSFVHLPLNLITTIFILVVLYLFTAEVAKRIFYKKLLL